MYFLDLHLFASGIAQTVLCWGPLAKRLVVYHLIPVYTSHLLVNNRLYSTRPTVEDITFEPDMKFCFPTDSFPHMLATRSPSFNFGIPGQFVCFAPLVIGHSSPSSFTVCRTFYTPLTWAFSKGILHRDHIRLHWRSYSFCQTIPENATAAANKDPWRTLSKTNPT